MGQLGSSSSSVNITQSGVRLMSSMAELMSSNVLTLLVGTGTVVSLVVIAAVLLLNRRSKRAENRLEGRKTSHVTEVLQVGNILPVGLGLVLTVCAAGRHGGQEDQGHQSGPQSGHGGDDAVTI